MRAITSMKFSKQKILSTFETAVQAVQVVSAFRQVVREIRDLQTIITEVSMRIHAIESEMQAFWNDYAEFKAAIEGEEFEPLYEEDLH